MKTTPNPIYREDAKIAKKDKKNNWFNQKHSSCLSFDFLRVLCVFAVKKGFSL